MSFIRINSISVKNFRSFGENQEFLFPDNTCKKPIAIVGYNNSGKTNLMNAILYGIGEKFITERVFEKTDLHNLEFINEIQIISNLSGSYYTVPTYWNSGESRYTDQKNISGSYTITAKVEDKEIISKCTPSFFGATKHYNTFYINFHNIKEEISTQKTSWGNLRSFLAKHIKKIVENDEIMSSRKDVFKSKIREATKIVLEGEESLNSDGEKHLPENSLLQKFIDSIKKNYSVNLRNNDCEVEFGLPDYEDIFFTNDV